MKYSWWPLVAAVILSGCISKTKYDLELEKIEKVYSRIDHMTNAMNQMGSEINRLKSTQSNNKTENESVIRKLRIEELELSDVESELKTINEAMDAYNVHHEAGRSLLTHFNKLKELGTEALNDEHVHFLADQNQIGFIIETSIFAPANSPKINSDLAASLQKLVRPINEFDTRRYQIVAHVDTSMPTGRRYETVSALGLDRSVNILSALIDAGVKPGKLSAAVVVASQPIPADASPEERAWGRRIEIRVVRDLKGNPGFETLHEIETGKLRL